MKTFIKTSALVVAFGLFATSLFAADAPVKKEKVAVKEDVVLFNAINSCGVGVIVHKAEATKTLIQIFDAKNNMVYKDYTSKNEDVVLKGYGLKELENGDYTIKVTTNNKEVKRTVCIYTDEHNQKAFMFKL